MKNIDRTASFFLCLWLVVWPWQTRFFLRLGGLNGYWEYGTISLYASDIIFAVFLLFAIPFVMRTILQTEAVKDKTLLSLACLDLFIFFSIFWAQDKFLAVYRYLLLLIGVFMFLFLRHSKETGRVVRYFILGLVVPAIYSLVQFFMQISWSSKWFGLAAQSASRLGAAVIETANGSRWLRAYGSFDHPNINGAVLALAVVFSIRSWLSAEQKIDKIIFSSTTVLFLAACFVAFSRAAFLGLVVGLVTLTVFSRRWQPRSDRRLFAIIITCMIVLISFSIINREFLTARTSEGRLENKSINERITGVGAAIDLAGMNWWHGVGLGNYGLALSRIDQGKDAYGYQPVHNVALLVLVEIGLFGLASLLIFFIQLVISFWRGRSAIGISIIATMATMMIFDHWWWSLHSGLIAWFLAGAGFVEKKE